jgi:general secretion pathway protein K
MNVLFADKRGVALLMVLWVLMLLTVIVGEFCFTMRTRVNITRNFKESTQAYYIAVAGLNQAIEQIIRQEIMPQKTVTVDEAPEEESALDWRINTDIAPMAFGNGEYEVRIENESGKININLADKGLLKTMLSGFDIDDLEKDVIADSILDWRDADRNHRLNGAENDYYQTLPKPYKSKDDDFDSIDELLLVRGVTPEIYFKGLENLVTVFPKNKKQGGKQQSKNNEFDYNKLNVNAIPTEMWAALPGMTEELISEIQTYRSEKDFQSLGEVQTIIGPDVFGGIARYLTIRTTPYYKISSTGKIRDSRISEGVTAVILFSNQSKEKYQIIEWIDEISYQNRFKGISVSFDDSIKS